MKKFFAAVILTLVCFCSYAQEYSYNENSGEIVMSYVIEDTNLSINDAIIASENAFNHLYKNSNVTRRHSNSNDKLFYAGSFGVLSTFNMGVWEIIDNHCITIHVKDNRIKITISSSSIDLNMNRGNGIGEGTRYWSELYPIDKNMKVSKTNITKTSAEQAHDNWKHCSTLIIREFEKYIRNNKIEEDW